MLVLFDHGTPAPIRPFLEGHSVKRTQDMGWDRLTNGELLDAAEESGFDLLLTTDKNIRYQQRLAGRKIAIVVLGNAQWPVLRLHVQRVVAAVSAATPGSYSEVDIPDRRIRRDSGAALQPPS
jgi:hypothetical protein